MAIGADRAILIETLDELQPLAVAQLLKALFNREQPDLTLVGKQAIDDDCNQTGQMLAALARLPRATFASRVELADGHAIVAREVDGGSQTLRLRLPAIITTDLRLNEPPERSAGVKVADVAALFSKLKNDAKVIWDETAPGSLRSLPPRDASVSADGRAPLTNGLVADPFEAVPELVRAL